MTCRQQQSAVVKTSRDDAEKESADSVPPKGPMGRGQFWAGCGESGRGSGEEEAGDYQPTVRSSLAQATQKIRK